MEIVHIHVYTQAKNLEGSIEAFKFLLFAMIAKGCMYKLWFIYKSKPAETFIAFYILVRSERSYLIYADPHFTQGVCYKVLITTSQRITAKRYVCHVLFIALCIEVQFYFNKNCRVSISVIFIKHYTLVCLPLRGNRISLVFEIWNNATTIHLIQKLTFKCVLVFPPTKVGSTSHSKQIKRCLMPPLKHACL